MIAISIAREYRQILDGRSNDYDQENVRDPLPDGTRRRSFVMWLPKAGFYLR